MGLQLLLMPATSETKQQQFFSMVLLTNTCSSFHQIPRKIATTFLYEVHYGSNHYPYTTSLSGDDLGFPLAKTLWRNHHGYFATTNYLDSSIKAFFDYLKRIWSSKKFHHRSLWGPTISNSRNPALAPLLGKNSETWSSYDNAMLQRITCMVVIQVWIRVASLIPMVAKWCLPTLEHL